MLQKQHFIVKYNKEINQIKLKTPSLTQINQ